MQLASLFALGSLLVLPSLPACSLFDGDDDDGSDALADSGPADTAVTHDATTSGSTAPATGMAAAFGIVDYALTPAPYGTTDVRVTLRGASGVALGAIDISATAEGFAATLTSLSGTFVYRASAKLVGDELWITRAFGTSDLLLRNHSVAVIDAAGELVERSSVLAVPGDPEAVSLGGPWRGPESDLVALDLFGAGGEVAVGTLTLWLEQVTPLTLLAAPELERLVFALEDPALIAALESTSEAAFAPVAANALHVSPECKSLRARVHAETIPPCRKCAELDPNIDSAVPEGLAGPNLLLLPYLPDCRKCAAATNARQADIASCVKAWRRPQDVYDDARCARENPAMTARRWVASPDGHGCSLVCDPEACAADCRSLWTERRGIAVAPACESDLSRQECHCHPNYDAYCRAKHPGAICGPPPLQNLTRCDAAICGDGELTVDCPESPAAAETCDATSGAVNGGCTIGSGCSSDCRNCTPCECGGGDQSCPTGSSCDGCRCREAACNSDLLDLINGQGQWCDYKEPERWCGAGGTCDGATCRCGAKCGDGVIGEGEACDTASSSDNRGCPSDQTCTASCACSDTCGNGVVEPHESCDPNAATPSCGAGRTCSGCACVEACGNGVIDDGEACDKASANVCGGGQACNEECQCETSCGNRKNDTGEACDRSVSSGYPHYGCDPSLACLDDCTCGAPVCGNDRLEANEECDTSGFTCPSSDFSACTKFCECSRAASCGDGELQAGEECDYKLGPGPCGGEGAFAGYLPKCKARECRCECPTYTMTECVLADRTIQCPEGTHCDTQAQACSQDTCPSGAVFIGGSAGVCECQGGNATTTIYDPCRVRYVLACVPNN